MSEYNHTNSPKHYDTVFDKEVYEIIHDVLGDEMFKGFCLGNILKYRLRAGKKPNEPVERDIEKALKYEEIIKNKGL